MPVKGNPRFLYRSLFRRLGLASAFLAAGYGAYVGVAWLRYGSRRRTAKEDADALLDCFMPEYEVAERHRSHIHAPAGLTLAVACDLDFEDSQIVRTIFKGREFLLHGQPREGELPRGLLAKMKALGWGVLAEAPGREIVMGAVTQPWRANVEFHAIAPELFASFNDPEYIKIVWTLRADAVTAATSIFRTETRVIACGPAARSKFRKYWAFLSPGIVLIRLALLGQLRREAERRARHSRTVSIGVGSC